MIKRGYHISFNKKHNAALSLACGGTLWGSLWGPLRQGSLWAQVSLAYHHCHFDRSTIKSIHTRRSLLNTSAAPTNHSRGMSYCRADQSNMCVQAGVCVCEYEWERGKKVDIRFVYRMLRHHHTHPLVTICLWLLGLPTKVLLEWSTSGKDVINVTFVLTQIW